MGNSIQDPSKTWRPKEIIPVFFSNRKNIAQLVRLESSSPRAFWVFCNDYTVFIIAHGGGRNWFSDAARVCRSLLGVGFPSWRASVCLLLMF